MKQKSNYCQNLYCYAEILLLWLDILTHILQTLARTLAISDYP